MIGKQCWNDICRSGYIQDSRAFKHKEHVYTVEVTLITMVSKLPALFHTVDSIIYSKFIPLYILRIQYSKFCISVNSSATR